MSNPIVLVASGDSRLPANRVCWPAQEALEGVVQRVFGTLGRQVRRGHAVDLDKGHGFIDSQARGIEVFRQIDPGGAARGGRGRVAVHAATCWPG